MVLQDALPLEASLVSSAGVSEVTRLTPSGAPVFSLAVDGAAPGSNPAAPDDRQQVCSTILAMMCEFVLVCPCLYDGSCLIEPMACIGQVHS